MSVCKLEWGNKENIENIKTEIRNKTNAAIEVVIGCEILYAA